MSAIATDEHSRLSFDNVTKPFAFAIDAAPHIHSLAANRDHHLVEMPSIVRPRSSTAKISGDRRPEL
jgi:hypothetical protein